MDAGPIVVNRLTSDGDLIEFRKDNSTVGSIGTKSNRLYIGNGDTGLYFVPDNDSIYPWDTSTNGNRDAAIDLGQSSNRFKDLYLSGGAYLGGTAAANKLDDYEEGTWSPVYEPASGSFTTMTMDIVNATYTKVGSIVTINVFLRTDNVDVGTASGDLKISGIPFTASGYNAVHVGYSHAFTGDHPTHGWVQGSQIILRYRSSAGKSFLKIMHIIIGS